jgi:hypothetical protein
MMASPQPLPGETGTHRGDVEEVQRTPRREEKRREEKRGEETV